MNRAFRARIADSSRCADALALACDPPNIPRGHPVPKQNARANDLLRRRDSLRKTRQLWIAGLVIWGVVVGWVVFGFVNSVTDDMDVRLTWVAHLAGAGARSSRSARS